MPQRLPTPGGDNCSHLSDNRTPTDGSVTDTKIAAGGLTNSAIRPTAGTPARTIEANYVVSDDDTNRLEKLGYL